MTGAQAGTTMGGVPSLPLYPTDDGWPYPDALAVEPAADDDTGEPHSMKNLALELGCNHAEARAVLGGALDKLRQRLITP